MIQSIYICANYQGLVAVRSPGQERGWRRGEGRTYAGRKKIVTIQTEQQKAQASSGGVQAAKEGHVKSEMETLIG